MVRVVQWDRRCFENYLLDADAIYDATRELKRRKNDLDRSGFAAKLRELALGQLSSFVAKAVYAPREPENAGVRPKDVAGSYEEIGSTLGDRIDRLATQVKDFDKTAWVGKFVEDCKAEEAKRKSDWEAHWHRLADGKRLIEELHHWIEPNLSPMEFKRGIVKAMSQHATDNWKVVDSILSNALK
jgi:hypothetical protein